ncbi:oligopeptidase B [Phlyctochytrium arcticum]|nr:oligopeptidase B [Phlyctochytrium arcticum]
MSGPVQSTIPSKTPAAAPVAKKVPYQHKYHGKSIDDPFHWLKDMNKEKNPEIIEYIKQENEFSKAQHLEPNAQLTDTIYNEFISRLQEDDEDVPVFRKPYYYYKRTVKGQQYPIYARRKDAMSAPEEVFLNQNEFTDEYQDLGFIRTSPDHKLLAYALDTKGDEKYKIYFKDLSSGTVLESDTVPEGAGEGEWTNDGKALCYTAMDDILRPYKIMRHTLGTKPSEDETIYEENDQQFLVGIHTTNSRKFICIVTKSSLTRETWTLDADDSKAKPQLFQKRKFRVQYDVDHHNDRFLVLTDNGGEFLNGKLMWCPLDKTESSNWVEVLPYDPLKHTQDMDSFQNFVVLSERSDALLKIRILNVNEKGTIDNTCKSYYLEFSDDMYAASATGTSTQSYDADHFRYTYSSLLCPIKTLEYNVKEKESKLLKQQPVPNFDASKYEMKRIWAPIPEDTKVMAPFNTPVPDKIPIALLYRKDIVKQDGTNPAYLHGYGSYGISRDLTFSSAILSFADHGFVWATAAIRGGGECGNGWYETGKFKHKRNTFTDFIAAADELVKQKYTQHDLLAIYGGSAGGLLIGATINLRPDVAAVAVASVPFVDVINTMMDDKVPLTINEYEEWGNPNEKDYFDYMLSYSPYDNVKKTDIFPDLLVKAGINDPRVAYWEPAKWVAKLRDLGLDQSKEGNKVVFDCKMGSGHFGSSGRYAHYKETASDYAFIMERIGRRLKAKGLPVR